jgi:GMP synthase (glutamine-hydrolysing)
VDFGAQYAQLIARRIREARIYSEVVPSTMSANEMLAKNPLAIVLSGGPSSVYAEGAPQVDGALFDANLPVFGICYGFQAMAATLGGKVAQTGLSEFGATELKTTAGSCLFDGLPEVQNVWMSHGDSVQEAPAGFTVTASSAGAAVAAFEDLSRGLAGVQFHPEVMHSEHGQKVLEHFLYNIAKIEPTWTPASIVDEQVARIDVRPLGHHVDARHQVIVILAGIGLVDGIGEFFAIADRAARVGPQHDVIVGSADV